MRDDVVHSGFGGTCPYRGGVTEKRPRQRANAVTGPNRSSILEEVIG